MDNRVKYSVIIPVYNSEKTLRRCIDSLVRQGRPDAEIILVNDGSTDGSEELILDYKNKYPQIVYICQENGGPSRARNTGLCHAKGEYVTFVDSDDYVTESYFSTLDSMGDQDFAVFCHRVIGDDPRDMSALFAQLQKLSGWADQMYLLLRSRRIMSPWDKRFRRSIIEQYHLRFAEGLHIGEDYNFTMAYAMHCTQVHIVSQAIICNDITDQSSLSRKYRPDLPQQLLRGFTMAEATISSSQQPEKLRRKLSATNDYLFVKLAFSCILELYKVKDVHYFRDRQQIAAICDIFRQPLTHFRLGLLHRILRLGLGLHLDFLFWLVCWAVNRKRTGNRGSEGTGKA